MLDVTIPGNKDAEVTLLYQTAHLKDVNVGEHLSKITKEGFTLNVMHIAPEFVKAEAVETPHYLNTLLKMNSLVKKPGARQ